MPRAISSRVFRHIAPFVKSGATVLKAAGDVDGMQTLLFRNPDGTQVLVAACQAGRGAKDRTGGDAYEPRPKLYIRYKGEYKHLPLPFGTWSVTTVVFK